jgi:hypothetical protein
VIRGLRYQHVRASSGRTSSTWRLKKLLASLIAIGALSSITVTGTYALLNSEETNHSTIASGTLTFSNTVGSGTACFSYGGPSSPGNVNTGCDALLTSATLNYPGVPITPVNVTITNNGSIDAARLSVYMPSCTAAATPSAPAPGGANPCSTAGAQIYIQETTSAWTATQCWFPASTPPTPCAFASNSVRALAVNVSTPASAINLGSGPAHGQSRYFQIGMQLPSTASNALQGEEAVFALTWRIST